MYCSLDRTFSYLYPTVTAQVLFIITVALSNASVSHGLGRHVVYLQPDQISYTLDLSAILQSISIVSCRVRKLAVVMLVLKLVALRNVISGFYIPS